MTAWVPCMPSCPLFWRCPPVLGAPLLWSLSIARLLQLYSAGGASGEINERRVKFQFLLFWFQFLTSDSFQVTSAFSMPVVLYLTCWDESIPLYLAVSGPLCPAQKLLCSEDARPPCGPMPLDPCSALMLPHAKLAPPAVLESQRNLNFTTNLCEPCEKWIFSNTTDPVLDAASSGWVQ
jgi:hypothetical protein